MSGVFCCDRWERPVLDISTVKCSKDEKKEEGEGPPVTTESERGSDYRPYQHQHALEEFALSEGKAVVIAGLNRDNPGTLRFSWLNTGDLSSSISSDESDAGSRILWGEIKVWNGIIHYIRLSECHRYLAVFHIYRRCILDWIIIDVQSLKQYLIDINSSKDTVGCLNCTRKKRRRKKFPFVCYEGRLDIAANAHFIRIQSIDFENGGGKLLIHRFPDPNTEYEYTRKGDLIVHDFHTDIEQYSNELDHQIKCVCVSQRSGSIRFSSSLFPRRFNFDQFSLRCLSKDHWMLAFPLILLKDIIPIYLRSVPGIQRVSVFEFDRQSHSQRLQNSPLNTEFKSDERVHSEIELKGTDMASKDCDFDFDFGCVAMIDYESNILALSLSTDLLRLALCHRPSIDRRTRVIILDIRSNQELISLPIFSVSIHRFREVNSLHWLHSRLLCHMSSASGSVCSKNNNKSQSMMLITKPVTSDNMRSHVSLIGDAWGIPEIEQIMDHLSINLCDCMDLCRVVIDYCIGCFEQQTGFPIIHEKSESIGQWFHGSQHCLKRHFWSFEREFLKDTGGFRFCALSGCHRISCLDSWCPRDLYQFRITQSYPSHL